MDICMCVKRYLATLLTDVTTGLETRTFLLCEMQNEDNYLETGASFTNFCLTTVQKQLARNVAYRLCVGYKPLTIILMEIIFISFRGKMFWKLPVGFSDGLLYGLLLQCFGLPNSGLSCDSISICISFFCCLFLSPTHIFPHWEVNCFIFFI